MASWKYDGQVYNPVPVSTWPEKYLVGYSGAR